jgi:hypothetical protein
LRKSQNGELVSDIIQKFDKPYQNMNFIEDLVGLSKHFSVSRMKLSQLLNKISLTESAINFQ